MLRHIFSAFTFALLAGPLAAQSDLPDRRIVVTNNMDFYGSDLTALFDTTFDACRTACLSNAQCQAFTYNAKSKACFPKSAVTQEVPYEGAYSARVLPTDSRVLTQAETRQADLEFLGDYTLGRAHELALKIGGMHPAGTWTTDAMMQAARDKEADGDYLNAMRWTGATVSVTDSADDWIEYARLSLAIEQDRSRYTNQAMQAATNGYFRALNDGARVNALLILGEVLERDGRGRDTVKALRLANDIQPRADVVAALGDAAGKYGFRITDNSADNESASPRICAQFSEDLIQAGTDYAPFVRLPDPGLVVQVEGQQLCVDGVEHGARYAVTFRKGLPAADGQTLLKDVEITLYVRDRSPMVAFPGRAYVLPRAADAALPIETVNLDQTNLTLRRVSDRNLLRAIQDDYFGRPLSDYELTEFSEEVAQDVWTGVGVLQNELNQTMTTRLPMGEFLADQPPGIYALTARIDGVPLYDDPGATQWFVLTDLGLTTLKGTDGLHVFARALGTAKAIEGVKLTLLSRANAVLGTGITDSEGHLRFDPGLSRGTGGAAPALVLAERGDQDMAFLSLTDPAFDLSDRGVEGRPPAPPVDVFLATDRGAYRAGEVIHATALARDALANAIPGVPLTAILNRPDGVEYSRHLSGDDTAGGHVFTLPVGTAAPRGTWTLDIKADVDAPALASTQILVEDFLPERIDFTLTLPEGALRPAALPLLKVDAKYLFGAPGAGLKSEGKLLMKPSRSLDDFPGYVFGRHDTFVSARVSYLDSDVTDDTGALQMPLSLPEMETQDRPHEATITVSLREGSGRPVERQIKRMIAPSAPMIGIKAAFDGVVPEGTTAEFQVIAVNPDLTLAEMPVKWTLNRVETRYQWYQQWGNWEWEPITTRSRVATGTGILGADPLNVEDVVQWGQYELVVERTDGAYAASSDSFYAGWYAPADATQTPDTLGLSLNSESYRPGESAQLRIVPRYAGTALITVMSSSVIDRQSVEVREGENLIPLQVTDAWGAGAYVTVQVIRPMDVAAGQNPARALGLAYAAIDPGPQQLSVSIDAPNMSDPRGPLSARVKVGGLNGQAGFVTLAAVDLGILNLTGFKSPDPSQHYFGQQRLGVEIRDIYGRLIDGMNGAAGQVRSGGDAGSGMDLQSPPPTQDLVAYFTGPVQVGTDGMAQITFDMPDFNGTVRLMAIAWSPEGVGQAERDVLVRDPVVVTASVPRFLAPGDTSRLLLEVVHATGPTGRMGLDVATTGVTLSGTVPSGFDLTENGKATFSLPLTAGEVGDHQITIALTTPDGRQLTKSLTLPVRANDPEVSQTRRFSLAAGDTFTLTSDIFAGLRPGTGQAVMAAGPLAQLNAPGLLQSLDRYPYGCTEQIASRAMPLLYFNQVASALDIGNAAEIDAQIEQAVERVLTRQTSDGAFGLWRAESGDFWLDSYVADFLSRARATGHAVPDRAFAMAMDNLRNRVNYASDFDDGGQDIAYALMVLAREGAASMGDLRYYADVKAGDFATPLALAQLGAALASYGDQTRADRMFALATSQTQTDDEGQLWRADYGTSYRDRAGVLALMVEAGSTVGDTGQMASALTGRGPHMSTQEQAWTLLAAHALIQNVSAQGLELNGAPMTGPLVKLLDAETMVPQTLTNTAATGTEITLTTLGVPEKPGPADGYGYRIERSYYDLDGQPAILNGLKSGERLVAALKITPFGDGEARLIIDDPLPAGLEIDNPNLLRSGDIRSLDWLQTVYPEHSEFRSDRFIAAIDWREDKPFTLAYIVRAISPGEYHHPAATVEDMYRPEYRAYTDTGQMTVTE
ncbi:alpha-2-macroglobulin family protein [Rhodobacteraceae bacterium KMM 6894]|nr:alpha-2-macroglobulin family protein [Rhodobacteraceae bacterium KMM 6894]